MNINETYPSMKRKPMYPPTNNITLNVLQFFSKIHSIVSKICSYMVGFPRRGNCHYEQRKCNQYSHPLNIILNVVQTYSRIHFIVFRIYSWLISFFSRGNYLVCGSIKWLWLHKNFEWLPWHGIKGSA